MLTRTFAASLMLLVASHAQTETQTKPETPPAPPTPPAAPADPMAGPKVAQPAVTYTLVRRGFNGALERLSQPVEEAAIAVLPLSDEEKTKTTKVIVDRAAAVDKGIADSIPLLLRIQGIAQEGLTSDRQSAIRELDRKVPILRDRDPYRAELRLALGAENAARFDAVVNEYVRAAILDSSAKAKAEGRQGNPLLMSVGESLRNVGMEVQQSFERVTRAGTDRLERAIEVIQPTAEQESSIRAAATEYNQQTLGKPTQAQKGEFVRKIMGMLTIQQRERLVAEWYGAAPAAEAKPAEAAPGGK